MNHPIEDNDAEARSESSDGSEPGSGFVVRAVVPMLLLIAGVGTYVWFSRELPQISEPAPKPQALEVRVAELNRQDFQIRVPTHGVVQAHGEASLTAQVAGRVQKLHSEFEVGAFFSEGEVLLEIDTVDFEEALINARAQLAQAEFNLEQERVKAKQARLNWEDLGYDEEPSDLVMRIPQVKLAESQLARANAQLLSAERNLERTKVRAPFHGRVISRSVGVGQTIGVGTAIGIIVATDFSEVRLPVSTRFLTDISLPEDITDPPIDIVLRDGINEQAQVEWPAQILRTEGALDASTLELFAVARVRDPFALHSEIVPLRIGQPVTSAIPGRTLTDVFVIPREAVSDLSRIRLVDPEQLTLRTAFISQLWADDESLVFRDPTIKDGTLFVLNRLVYAPDGGKVQLVEDDVIVEEEAASESNKGDAGK